MDAKKCDRCGKFFGRNENKDFDGGVIMFFDFDIYWVYENAKIRADLCENCIKELERWLNDDNT